MDNQPEPILWIARMLWPSDVRVREVELAKAMAPYAKVFALDRTKDVHVTNRSLCQKILFRWRMLAAPFKKLDGNRFQMPVAAFNDRFFASDAAAFNNKQISKALAQFQCKRVFLSNPFFFMPPTARDYSVHFDLVDNFFDEWDDSPTGKARKEFLTETIRRADTVSVISHALSDRMKELTGRVPVYLPNGVDLQAIQAWPDAGASAVRDKYGIGDSRLFVYIGNHHAAFDGMKMLLKAFAAAFIRDNTLRLMLVGPGSEGIKAAGVIGVGPMPVSKVWDYFKAADVGVLPFWPCRLTHDSLPLKVLEFAAAGKPMLATPLHELKRIGFEHLTFVEYDSQAWAQAMLGCSAQEIKCTGLGQFTWKGQAKRLAKLMLGHKAGG